MGHTTPTGTKVPLEVTTATLRQMADPIRTLLASGGLHTVFQPILDGATREPIGYEALTRGPANHELNSPIALIAVAAKSGLSTDELPAAATEWAAVCERAAADAARLG